jgi:hypothetical protein
MIASDPTRSPIQTLQAGGRPYLGSRFSDKLRANSNNESRFPDQSERKPRRG